MTWTPITDTTDTTGDESPLSSGLGVDLKSNADHVLANRLKRHSVTYNLGPTSSGGGTPPAGDSTLVGPTLPVAGSSASDPEAIGLKLSSPPTMPLSIDLGSWPLSSQATSIRVVVGCSTAVADVDLFAYALADGGSTPLSPLRHLVPDEDGKVSFSNTLKATDAHATVGTSSPSGTQDSKPVALTIDLGSATGTDYGHQGDPGGRRSFRLFLCILSTAGALDGSLSQGGVSSFQEGGRRINFVAGFDSTWGINPGPLHRWIKFPGNADDEILNTSDAWVPKWRGVLQARPADLANPASSPSTSFVIHPSIGLDSALRTNTDFEIYTVGTITIHSITIQEFGT